MQEVFHMLRVQVHEGLVDSQAHLLYEIMHLQVTYSTLQAWETHITV